VEQAAVGRVVVSQVRQIRAVAAAVTQTETLAVLAAPAL